MADNVDQSIPNPLNQTENAEQSGDETIVSQTNNEKGKSTSDSPDLGISKMKRPAESRRRIAFDRLKRSSQRCVDEELVQSMTKMEVQISLDLITKEWERFIEAHYEISDLAATADAEKVIGEFFEKVAKLYAVCRERMEVRLQEIINHPDQTMGGSIPQGGTSASVLGENDLPIEPFSPQGNSSPRANEGATSSSGSGTKEKIQPFSGLPTNASNHSNIPMVDDLEHDVIEFLPSPITPNNKLNAIYNLKLEPIKIPVFNGEKENWVLFRDQFIALVHENDRMNDAIRIYQLFTHLGEKALRVIKGITPAS